MFKPNKLQTVINSILDDMEHADPTTPEYSRMADQLNKLMEAKETNSSAVSKARDTAIVAGTNLLGIIAIANYEKAAVWTTRAFSHMITK